MKTYIRFILIFLLVFQGCAAWKAGLNNNGDYNSAIHNAILDFSNTTSLYKQDSTFSVDFKEFNNEVIGVSIMGTINKFIVTEEGKSSRLPNRCLKHDGKLFYWYDENHSLDKKVINQLDSYNLIDSVKTIAFAEFINNDAKKGVDYYFCRENLLKYKKIKTNKAMGYYELPKLNCK